MANQTTPQFIGIHSVAAGSKDAANPAYNTANAPLKNVRFDKYLSAFITINGGTGPVSIVGFTGTKDALAPAREFGLAGTLTINYATGAVFSLEIPLLAAGKDIGFFVNDGAGGNIVPACTIKVLASSDKG